MLLQGTLASAPQPLCLPFPRTLHRQQDIARCGGNGSACRGRFLMNGVFGAHYNLTPGPSPFWFNSRQLREKTVWTECRPFYPSPRTSSRPSPTQAGRGATTSAVFHPLLPACVGEGERGVEGPMIRLAQLSGLEPFWRGERVTQHTPPLRTGEGVGGEVAVQSRKPTPARIGPGGEG